jgi:hypothetical protein
MAPEADELRRNWRHRWLSSIRELSALDWQKSLWGKSENRHQSYVEYVESYSDDLILSDGYSWAVEKGFLSPDEAKAVAPMHELLNAYKESSSHFDHDAILADPGWIQITKAAEQTRQRLLETLTDANEQQILKRIHPEFP